MAVKVIRNVDKYRQAAMIEMEVLNTLQKNDEHSTQHCIFMREWVRLRTCISATFILQRDRNIIVFLYMI